MEMIMSMISTPMERRDSAAGSLLRRAGGALTRWWLSYVEWRLEQISISQLRSMNDCELRDIGISRSEIEFVVRYGTGRDRIFARYY
jgi:uncharacterized protein YjiS (DUF1127 family)